MPPESTTGVLAAAQLIRHPFYVIPGLDDLGVELVSTLCLDEPRELVANVDVRALEGAGHECGTVLRTWRQLHRGTRGGGRRPHVLAGCEQSAIVWEYRKIEPAYGRDGAIGRGRGELTG